MPNLAGAGGDWPEDAMLAHRDTPHTDYEAELAADLMAAEEGDRLTVRSVSDRGVDMGNRDGRDFVAEVYDVHEPNSAARRLRFEPVEGGNPADAWVVRGKFVFILTPDLDPLLMGFPESARGGIDVHV